MSCHTSFRVGGPADLYVAPLDTRDIIEIRRLARRTGSSLFVVGAGANILVSDRGIRGIVVDMRMFDYAVRDGSRLIAGAGSAVTRVCEIAATCGLSGFEFIYAMPGSVGGAVWMNARCYGRSVSDVLESVTVVRPDGATGRIVVDPSRFSYKSSPFQQTDVIIVEAAFRLRSGKRDAIRRAMRERFDDRRAKGHFRAPSVGSIFKNNRTFGAPTGQIIDSLGLKGFRIGGAHVAEYHANIIVNSGDATAGDILEVIEHVERCVRERTGIVLEREVRLVGEWTRGR